MTSTDIRQSKLYAQFMQNIGWVVEQIDSVFVYIKPFPLFGAVIKIQRADAIPSQNKLTALMKKYHAHSISFEPSISNDLQATNYKLLKDPFLPTKTIQIDLNVSEQALFKNFTEAKQRAVRRAQKAGVEIKKSDEIDAFIQLKNKTAGFLGFLTTTTVKPLWNIFNAQGSVLIAYANNQPIAGILLLWHDRRAYYWMATATSESKKLFAPTLLVWEAIKVAKQNGCTTFDFDGVYDERYPSANKNWLGFTKFKAGFGGKEVYFSKPFKLL